MLFFFFTLLVWYQSKPHEILLIWKLDALYLFAKFNPFQTKTIKIQWMTNYRKRFWFSIKKRRWSKSKSTRCMTKWEWRGTWECCRWFCYVQGGARKMWCTHLGSFGGEARKVGIGIPTRTTHYQYKMTPHGINPS